MAGYISWAIGFAVGVLPNILPDNLKGYAQPAPLYSFIVGFVVYAILAKAGLQPKAVEPTQAGKA